MKTDVQKEKPGPASNEMAWAFDLGKGSIGEAVRQGNKFLHKASEFRRAYQRSTIHHRSATNPLAAKPDFPTASTPGKVYIALEIEWRLGVVEELDCVSRLLQSPPKAFSRDLWNNHQNCLPNKNIKSKAYYVHNNWNT